MARRLAEVRRIGLVSQMVDPADPAEIVKVNIGDRVPVRAVGFATENYAVPLEQNDFLLYLRNSVFVTVMATLITLARKAARVSWRVLTRSLRGQPTQ